MKRFAVIINAVLMITALFVLVDRLLAPQPIHIVFGSGQEVTSQQSSYFSMKDAILLLVTSFIVGVTSTYLYFKGEDKITSIINKASDKPAISKTILNMLKEDEKKVYIKIFDNKGEILQNAIVNQTGLSRVKVTRIISRLEAKGLVERAPWGMTNKVKIKKHDLVQNE